MGIPPALAWADVLTNIGDLLSNGLVVSGITVSLALFFAPRIIRALGRAVRI
jgi:hypothetical protein